MSPYLAWFDEIPDEELAHAAGGKGASLCRMSRAGLPVPKGFIVRSEMFNAFMEANGLWDYVFEKLDTIDFSSDASLRELSNCVDNLISSAIIDRNVKVHSSASTALLFQIKHHFTHIAIKNRKVSQKTNLHV